MVCSKCGAFMPDRAAFCTECGAKLEMQKPGTPVSQFDDDDKTVYVNPANVNYDDDKTVYVNPANVNYDDDKTVYVNRGGTNYDDDKTVYINSGRPAGAEKILGAKRGFSIPGQQTSYSAPFVTGTVTPLANSGSRPVDKRKYLSVYATSAVRSKSQMALVLTVFCLVFMIASCVIAMVAPGDGLPMVDVGEMLPVALIAGAAVCLALTGFGGFQRSTVLLVLGTLLSAGYCLVFCGILFLLLSLVLHAVLLVFTMQLNKEYNAYCKTHQ